MQEPLKKKIRKTQNGRIRCSYESRWYRWFHGRAFKWKFFIFIKLRWRSYEISIVRHEYFNTGRFETKVNLELKLSNILLDEFWKPWTKIIIHGMRCSFWRRKTNFGFFWTNLKRCSSSPKVRYCTETTGTNKPSWHLKICHILFIWY